MNSKNNNTALIVIAVIAAFGLVMATAVAVLAIVPQAQAKGATVVQTNGGFVQTPSGQANNHGHLTCHNFAPLC
jgi:hypothetical protein